MGLSFTRAGDLSATDLHVLMLLYGDPGAGKTHAACLAPRPLVLLTERNGMTTIRRSNADALVVEVTNATDLGQIIKMAMDGKLPEKRRTLVIDSLTECQRLIKDEIMASKPKGAPFSLQDWGVMHERWRRFMRALRDVPYHVVCTALSEAVVSEADGVRYVQPAFEGRKTGSEVAQYFNAVGFCYKANSTDENGLSKVEHRCMFEGPSRYTLKPCDPLTGTQEPRPDVWLQQLTGE